MANPTPLQRFHSRTQPAPDDSDCILWTGAKLPKGYGRFAGTLAHRWIYERTHGVKLGRWDFVLHSCDTPSCVNVEHLRAGTAAENTADMDMRGRRNPHHPSGEANGRAKVNAEKAREVRQRANAGESCIALGREFGISPSTVRRIALGIYWSAA